MPHIHEKIDFTVEVFLVYKDTVLLRWHDKYDMWLAVGGHIELDEDPNEAAIREVKEEVGMEIKLFDKLRTFTHENEREKELIPPYFMDRNRINPTHEHVTMIYFAQAPTDKVVEMVEEREKSKKMKWFTKEEIQQSKEIYNHIKRYALRALEEIANS